jgi:uncharacterized protein
MENEILIPASHARAFEVPKDHVFRLAQVEGGQVADVIFFNNKDRNERFHAGYTAWFGCIRGNGTIRKVAELYSAPPFENVMATVVKDTVGVHFPYIGVRCSRRIYKMRDNTQAPPHRTCQDNLAEVIAPYGLEAWDVPDVFNLWMNVDIDENGCFVHRKTLAKKDDYMDLKAEMDLLVAISACPNDTTSLNDYRTKPLKAIVF